MNRLGFHKAFLVFVVRSVNAMNSLPLEVMPISKSRHCMYRCSCLPLSPKWRVLFIHTEFDIASGLSKKLLSSTSKHGYEILLYNL